MIIAVPGHFSEAVIAAQLVEDTQAARKETHACTKLGRDRRMCLEKNVLDVEFLKHVSQRQS